MSLEKIIWKQVHDTYVNARLADQDDLFQGCYEVALKAMKEYNLHKNTKLKTFIFACIKNYLRDEQKRSVIRKAESNALPIEELGEESYEYDDFLLTMKKILNDFQYEIFILHYCEDFSLEEIAQAKGLKKHEVYKCSLRIQQSYQWHVLNQKQTSTSRREKKTYRSSLAS